MEISRNAQGMITHLDGHEVEPLKNASDIYKVKEPYRIDKQTWAENVSNCNWKALTIKDNDVCRIAYLSTKATQLSNFSIEYNNTHADKLSFIMCLAQDTGATTGYAVTI